MSHPGCVGGSARHTSYTSAPTLHAAALGRAAAVVRYGRYVADAEHVRAGRLQGTDRSFAAATGALHEDLDLTQAVLHGAAGGAFCGHLRRERRALARALEVGR